MAFRIPWFAFMACACSTGSIAVPSGPPSLTNMARSDDAVPPPDVDPDPGAVNGCDEYDDLTSDGADRTIVWIRTVGRKCLQIRRGQTVRWDPQETFDGHPLRPFNGSSENPIAEQSSGNAIYSVNFDKPGIFGFGCAFHFDMKGAIRVIE